jgi:hypothetical protein
MVSDKKFREARYTVADVRAIIRAALERQRRANTVSREELDEVAAESGVSPEYLQAAIDEFERRREERPHDAHSESGWGIDITVLRDRLRKAQTEAGDLWRVAQSNQRRIWREFTGEF